VKGREFRLREEIFAMSFFDLFFPPNIEKMKAKRDVQGLLKALGCNKDYGDYRVRSDAAQALGEIYEVRAVEPLIAALEDSHMLVRSSAADALGKIRDTRAVEPLIGALKNKPVPYSVYTALGKIGDARAIETLIDTLKDSDWELQKHLVSILGELEWQPSSAEHRVLYAIASQNWDLAAQEGANAVELLITEVKNLNLIVQESKTDQNKTRMGETYDQYKRRQKKEVDKQNMAKMIRKRATEALRKIRDVHAVEPLIAALKDSEEDVRENAAYALGKIGAVEPLIAALKDSDEDVRETVAKILGEIGDPRAIEPLVTAALNYKNSDGDVWHLWFSKTFRALEKFPVKTIEPLLIAAFKDTELDSAVRSNAANLLWNISGVKLLIAVSNDKDLDEDTRKIAAAALKNHDDQIQRQFHLASGDQ
jgi:HEAT repeat protein